MKGLLFILLASCAFLGCQRYKIVAAGTMTSSFYKDTLYTSVFNPVIIRIKNLRNNELEVVCDSAVIMKSKNKDIRDDLFYIKVKGSPARIILKFRYHDKTVAAKTFFVKKEVPSEAVSVKFYRKITRENGEIDYVRELSFFYPLNRIKIHNNGGYGYDYACDEENDSFRILSFTAAIIRKGNIAYSESFNGPDLSQQFNDTLSHGTADDIISISSVVIADEQNFIYEPFKAPIQHKVQEPMN